MVVLGTYLIIFIFSITCPMYFADSNFVKYICEGFEERISCTESSRVIDTALYGRNGSNECPHTDGAVINQQKTLSICFDSTSLDVIKQNCDNKTECYLRANNDEFGDPCPGTYKYLYVEYTCKVDCPDGWISGTNVSFCYKLLDSVEAKYEEAVNLCKDNCSELVMPKTQEENLFLLEFLNRELQGGNEAWIGLTDKENEGNWYWTDGSELVFANWNTDEPNNVNGGEDCAGVYISLSKWNDFRCSEELHVVCQIKSAVSSIKCEDDKRLVNTSGTLVNMDGYCYGDTLKYACDPPLYKYVEGNLTRTCSENGTWNGFEPSCYIACSNDTNVINSSGILVDVSGFFYNDTLTYDCEPPAKRLASGYLIRTCTENGTWSGEEPVCENVTCPVEQRTINSTGFLVYMTGNHYNDSLLYECDSKYYIPKGGYTTRICNEQGIWSGSELNCQHCQCSSGKPLELAEFDKMIEELKVEKKTTSKSQRLKVSVKDDRPSAQGVGCIGIVFLIVAGAFMIIPDMPVLFRHIKSGLRNLLSAVYTY